MPTPPAFSADAERLLARHLAAFSGVTLLVLGDAMLDRYVHGEVRRISPEAPIPVLRARARRAVLGGAGNVAENAAALGARAILVGLVGAFLMRFGFVGILAVLGAAAGVAALASAPGGKDTTAGSAILFASLLAFAAVALTMPAVLL